MLTCLTESERLNTSDENKSGLVKKMKLYNKKKQVGITASDIKALHQEAPEEGMDGEGPRQIINALSLGLINDEGACLDPFTTLHTLYDMLDQNIQLTAPRREHFKERLSIAAELFSEDIKIEVQKGFTHGFTDAASDTFQRYIDNVGAFLTDDKIKNPITQEDEPANERFMREIEEMVGVGENQSKAFRSEIYTKMAQAQRAGRKFDYASHPQLKEGIEKALFNKLRDAIAVTTGQSHDPKNRERFNEVVNSMKELGYCEVCAGRAIKFVADRLT